MDNQGGNLVATSAVANRYPGNGADFRLVAAEGSSVSYSPSFSTCFDLGGLPGTVIGATGALGHTGICTQSPMPGR